MIPETTVTAHTNALKDHAESQLSAWVKTLAKLGADAHTIYAQVEAAIAEIYNTHTHDFNVTFTRNLSDDEEFIRPRMKDGAHPKKAAIEQFRSEWDDADLPNVTLALNQTVAWKSSEFSLSRDYYVLSGKLTVQCNCTDRDDARTLLVNSIQENAYNKAGTSGTFNITD